MMQRRTLHFSGNVQGIGFRYTTQRLSAGRHVGGFVRNLQDGRVELVVEGEAAALDAFIAAIGDHFGGSIQHIHRSDSPATGEYPVFEIRR